MAEKSQGKEQVLLKGRESQQIQNQKWFTQAYEDFKTRLCQDYLVVNDVSSKFDELIKKLNMIPGNSTLVKTDTLSCMSKTCFFLICPIIWWNTRTVFKVPKNSFALVIEEAESGRRTQIYGPGYHILGYYFKLQGVYSFDKKYSNNIIESSVGDLKIATVSQGTIMHLECGGQNIILGPGIHKITEPMQFIRNVRLDSFYIEIGPEKWVTVPDGYDGISINRGQIRVLSGGQQHHLKHVGDRFAKMVPRTLQTDRVPTDIPSYVQRLEDGSLKSETRTTNDPTEYLKTTTSEGSTVTLDVMVFWKIIDTSLAARTAMEILKIENIGSNDMQDETQAIKASSRNITMLRQNVLRMCKHHITSLVGTCSLAGKAGMQTEIKKDIPSVLNQDDYDDDFNEHSAQVPLSASNVNRQTYFSPIEDEATLENEDDDEQPLVKQIKQKKPKMQQTAFNKQLPPLQQQSSTKQTAKGKQASAVQEDEGVQNTFEILTFLQNEAIGLKDIINSDLSQIGCILDNICIYSVTPTPEIQIELDRQTKARVDANTAIIKALSRKEASVIEQQIQVAVSYEKAKTDAQVLKMNAQAQADSETTRAEGEAESIKVIAKARKTEAEELQSVQIATDLAQIRCAGEAGHKIFSGDSKNFVFGNNPGEMLQSMFNSFKHINKE